MGDMVGVGGERRRVGCWVGGDYYYYEGVTTHSSDLAAFSAWLGGSDSQSGDCAQAIRHPTAVRLN